MIDTDLIEVNLMCSESSMDAIVLALAYFDDFLTSKANVSHCFVVYDSCSLNFSTSSSNYLF